MQSYGLTPNTNSRSIRKKCLIHFSEMCILQSLSARIDGLDERFGLDLEKEFGVRSETPLKTKPNSGALPTVNMLSSSVQGVSNYLPLYRMSAARFEMTQCFFFLFQYS